MSNKNRKPFNKLYRNVLSSAKPPEEKGLGSRTVGRTEAREVTITPQILEEIYNEQEGKCALTNADLNLDFLYIPDHPSAPSVDRKDDSRGYSRDNIWIVLRFANKGRGTSSIGATVQTIQSIQAADYMLSSLYFDNPPYDRIFNDPIDNIIDNAQDWFDTGYERSGIIYDKFIKILCAPMSAGKTYNTFNYLIPELSRRKDVDIFYYFAPNCENIEEDEFEEYIYRVMKVSKYENLRIKFINVGGESSKTWQDVINWRNRGFKVIVGSTDASLKNILDDSTVVDDLLSLGDKFCLIRDEIHYGGTSHRDNLKKNMGSYNENYRARMFKLFEIFFPSTPWLFGFTATPTAEMKRDDFGTTKYDIMNSWATPNEMKGATAWIENLNLTLDTDRFTDDNYMKRSLTKMVYNCYNRMVTVEKAIESVIGNYSEKSDEYRVLTEISENCKTVCMAKLDVGDEVDKNGNKRNHKATLKRVMRMFKEIGLPQDFEYVVTTAAGWLVYDANGKVVKSHNGNGKPIKGNGWLGQLNDAKSNVRMVLVINKGEKGINVARLTDGVIYRNPVTIDKSEHRWIVHNSLQCLGRWVRPFWGCVDDPKYMIENGTGLTKLDKLNLLPLELRELILSNLNTFSIEVPKSDQWKEINSQFTDKDFGYAIHACDVLGWPFQRKVIK